MSAARLRSTSMVSAWILGIARILSVRALRNDRRQVPSAAPSCGYLTL
jgi:hypothetical protein